MGTRLVTGLAVTQAVGYGVLYYAFAVLLHPMAASLHASPTVVTGALTASVLAGAAMAVPAGRWLDRRGGRGLMTAGSLLATALILAWSQVRSVPQLYATLIGIGVAGAMVLYETALAVVVTWSEPRRRANALLAVIVVGGFASTVFMPLTGALADRYGWRTALVTLAIVYGVITVPLHATVVRPGPAGSRARPVVRGTPGPAGVPGGAGPGPGAGPEPGELASGPGDPASGPGSAGPDGVGSRSGGVGSGPGLAVRDARFWLLGLAFVAHGAAMAALTVHLVGFLVAAGHPPTFAATVAGLLGVLSVTGRLLLSGLSRWLPLVALVAATFTVQALAAIALLIAGHDRLGAAVAVTGFGLGFGVASLVRPALLAERYGTTAYGTINGILATPITVGRAMAPLAAAGLIAAGGYRLAFVATSACCLLAAVAILLRASSPPPCTTAPSALRTKAVDAPTA